MAEDTFDAKQRSGLHRRGKRHHKSMGGVQPKIGCVELPFGCGDVTIITSIELHSICPDFQGVPREGLCLWCKPRVALVRKKKSLSKDKIKFPVH